MADWSGRWVSYGSDPRDDEGVFCLRNRFTLDQVPPSLPVRVSADQRYKLYVNGEMVCLGPQRGDLEHWFFETIDIAPHLKVGENLTWALVWNFGWMAPIAQMSLRTAFLFDCPSRPELSTSNAWEITRVRNWDFAMLNRTGQGFFSAVGPGETWDGEMLASTSDIATSEAFEWWPTYEVRGASPRGATYEPYWSLVPRSIPLMRYEERTKAPKVRRGYQGDDASSGAPEGDGVNPLKTPVLLDFGELLCAYPRLAFTGPPGTVVTLTYSEAMWSNDPHDPKGNRNEVAGKEMRGYQDRVVIGKGRTEFEPLWFRTFRYLFIEADVPIDAEIKVIETGYPYLVQSSFVADDPVVAPIWEVAVRTAERCAGETYFDCPYYEQLQYAGDTRIQTLINYYLGRDRALARNAVEQFGWSLMSNGLTQSRYPNRINQVIPPFSLWWLLMQYDQWLYDAAWERRDEQHDTSTQIYSMVHQAFRDIQIRERAGWKVFWNFGDWVPEWPDGTPPGGSNSTVHALAHAITRTALARIDVFVRDAPRAFLKTEDARKEFETTPEGFIRYKKDPNFHPSEHAEALLRFWEHMAGMKSTPWPGEALAKAGAAKTTYYFSYYKHQALQPDDYLAHLGPWKEMIENGLTTFAEAPAPVRSDCHAWSAHPILGFFQLVAGVTSTSAAWGTARIAPKPGSLRRFDARIAHPKGELRVAFEDGRLLIDTPVPAELIWHGRSEEINAGKHQI